MKKTTTLTAVLLSLAFLSGGAIGWWLGYTRPVVKIARDFKATTGLSNDEVRDLVGYTDEMMHQLLKNDQSAAIHCLLALQQLEHGDVERSKVSLAGPIASYYVIQGLDLYPDRDLDEKDMKLRSAIIRASEQSEALRTAIASSLKDVGR